MNTLNAIGNLGQDAELGFSKEGTAIANFSFALSSGYGDRQKTTWLRCSLIGKRAETLTPMLTKGIKIGITGEISLNEYVNKAGETKASLECLVSNVTLLGKGEAKSETKKLDPSTIDRTGGFDDDFESDAPF